MIAENEGYLVYDAEPKQTLFHKAVRLNDYILFNGGRGSGKTTSGAIQGILEALYYQPGSKGVVVAPTYPMLEDASMSEFFAWLPKQYIADFNKQRKLLTLTNGSQVAFRSAETPDTLRGPNRQWAWMDEPRNLRTREAFDIIVGQLRPVRKIWLTTTPSGIFHWIYELFYRKPLTNSVVIKVRTAENPHLQTDFESSLREQYTGKFADQELDAEWTSFEGLIYDNFHDDNVSDAAEYNPEWDVLWGVDDGYARGEGIGSPSYHPRVFLLAQETPIGGLNVFAEYVAVGELPEMSLDNIFQNEYKKPTIAYVDSSAGELKTRIWQHDIQAFGATHKVSEGIKNVRRLIADGNSMRLLKVHPRCTNLIYEFQRYRYDDHAHTVEVGEPRPLKMDDHAMDALRYLAFHLRFDN